MRTFTTQLRQVAVHFAAIAIICVAGIQPAQAIKIVCIDRKLPSSVLKALEEPALDGDIDSAFQLCIARTLPVPDRILWCHIAIENGDFCSIQEMGAVLSKSTDPKQRRRADYLLRREFKERPAHYKSPEELLKHYERVTDENRDEPIVPKNATWPKW